ncbi:hypothetical protein MGYG_04292 [Nannizzia gypsea CBS 118893]|uniref:PH domain-containing protein n=1 Tax=Arthroderma gypseum (strain ATCC MYA-4604 / CBS 118893) TaxID=535722 RepID=E4US83_ARTGP|nr:hypothetical protein MGYG_04292 [Nannizzia gypsea CBS 118893]EFR01287.1 hypothetical protein MGYG_04292 [Nannizzia gypsea CBS 118893]
MASADAHPHLHQAHFAPQKLSRYRSVRASHPSSGPGAASTSPAAHQVPVPGAGQHVSSISRSMSRYRKTTNNNSSHGVPPPPLPLPAQLESQRNSYDLSYDPYDPYDPSDPQDGSSPVASRRVSVQQSTARPLTASASAARRSLDRNSAKRHSYSQQNQQFFDGRDSYERPSPAPATTSGPYFVVEPGMGPNTFDDSYETMPPPHRAPTTKKSKGRLLKEKGGGLLGRFKSEERHKKPKDKKTTSAAAENVNMAGVDAPVSAVNAGERKVTVTCNDSSVTLPVTPSTLAQDLIHSAANTLDEDIFPDAAIIVESFSQLNLERPLRKYEPVRDVLNSWNTDAQNILKIIPDPDPNILPALLAKSAPKRQPPDVSFNLYHCQRTGKWDRRWVTLRTDGQVTVSKKQGSADITNICHISDFDIYTPTRREYKRLKPPKPLCFAIKSQQKSAMFLSTENFVHYFCTKHEEVGGAWHNAVQEWRSWYLVHVMGEGSKKKQQPVPVPVPEVDDDTPYLGSLSLDHNIDDDTYDQPPGKRSRPPSYNQHIAPAGPLVNQAVNKEPVKLKRSKSKSTSKKKVTTTTTDDSLSEEQPFAPSGLLGRTYTQRHKAMVDREKEQQAVPDEGPFISTGLLSNVRHGQSQHYQGPSSHLSNHFPDQPLQQHQQHQHQHYHSTGRSNTMTAPADPRPTTTSSRSKSTRHPPKPLIDLTPTYKEPPQHARKGRGVAPIQGQPLVESATGPDLHPNAIVVPPSTTWRKPRTSDPSRHRSTRQPKAAGAAGGAGGGPLVDLAADPHGHSHMSMPGSFPFAPTGLVAQSQKLTVSQGASSKGRGVATGDRKKMGKPLLDMSQVPMPAHYQHPQADSD